MITPLSLTILSSAFPPERRGAIIGIWGGISGLGVASGPLIGGPVTQGLSWHWVFWVNVPVGIAAVIGVRLRLAESRGPGIRLDVPGLALVSAGAATDRVTLLEEHDQHIDNQIDRLRASQQQIQDKIRYYRSSLQPGRSPNPCTSGAA